MSLLQIIGCLSILFVILFVLARILAKKPTKSHLIFDDYSEHGKIWVRKMWALYISGLTWDKHPELNYELYEKQFGISLPLNDFGVKYNSYIKDLGIVENYLDLSDTTTAFKIGDFFFLLDLYLGLRFDYQYKPLRGKDHDEASNKYGLHLEADEILYYSMTKTDWYDEHTTNIYIRQNGFKYRGGNSMNFNTGSFAAVKDNITGFILLDRGSLHITNSRILFVGEETLQNRAVRLYDIIEYEIFKDGILLRKSNGKKLLIFFPPAIHTTLQPDSIGPVVRVLHRVLSGNQEQDLAPTDLRTI